MLSVNEVRVLKGMHESQQNSRIEGERKKRKCKRERRKRMQEMGNMTRM